MTHRHRDRRGFALALVILALVIIGALLAGAFIAADQEYRMGRNTMTQQRALTAAEFGQDSIYAGWNKAWNSIKSGSTFVTALSPGDGSLDTVRVTKLNTLSFLVVSEGRSGGGSSGARRRTAMVMRLNVPVVKTYGALTSSGNVTIGGSTQLLGHDSAFTGWNCPPTKDVPGVAVPSYSDLSFGGACKKMSCISGTPLVDTTSAAKDTSTYFSYGGMTWTDLVAAADKTVSGTLTGIQPSYSGSACNTADNNNWGDPNRNLVTPGACESYFPMIYAPGNLSINGNVGQGMLLVNGNLNIQGNFSFYGEIITRGTIKLTGTGNHINGGVLAANVVDSTSTSMLSGNSTIQYSSCTQSMALRSTAMVTRPKRSWAELF